MQAKPYIIGLTGGIGSGKSTVANYFADLGIENVDADIVSREVVLPGSPALQQISEKFGKEIIDSEGALRRADLRKIIFADPQARQWLESLLHPVIGVEIEKQLNKCHSQYCLLVSPLLLETDQHKLTHRILVVDSSSDAQLERTLQRDNSDRATIEAIIAAQMDRDARLEFADDVLENHGDLEALWTEVSILHQQYLDLAQQHEQTTS